METIFAEMSSSTALTWCTVIKTEFYTKHIKSEYFGIFIMKMLDFEVIGDNAYLRKYSTLQQGTHKIGF